MLCIHGVWNDPTLTLFKLVGSDNGKQLLERYYYQEVAQKVAHIPAFFVQWCGLRLSSHSRRIGSIITPRRKTKWKSPSAIGW
jgi:hypothetical protein